MPRLSPGLAREVRRIEQWGFSSVSISDHFTDGWEMDPLVAMAVATEATTELRVLSLVLAVDHRHPVQVHKAMATLDVVSGGRVEIGLGASWKRSEYDAAGIEFLPFDQRLERLAEAVTVLRGLFGDEPLDHDGRHYRVHLDGLPKPVQRPAPPILLGGYGDATLGLAASVADIVGIYPRTDTRSFDDKLRLVRSTAAAAGRDPEIQLTALAVHLTDVAPTGWRSSLLTPELERQLGDSPAILVGTLDDCERRLLDARERWGISYLNLGGPPDAGAPLVERLTGR